MDFENGQPEATSLGLRRSAAVLENLPFREDPQAPPLHPYRGIRLLLGLIAASPLHESLREITGRPGGFGPNV